MSKTKASPSKQLAENTSTQPTNEKKSKLESQEKNIMLPVETKGLVNGANGIIKDILYKPNDNLPFAILTEFNEYTGPRIFPGE